MPTTTINGTTLYWELTGDTGEPLILAHGSWQDHHSWDAVVPRLSQAFRVLTYDRRGHSASTNGLGTVHDDVADLAALIEHLDLAPAHIAGSSSGASIVLRLACVRPDLFRSLIVHEPPLLGLLNDVQEAQEALTAVRARLDAVQALLEAGQFAQGAEYFVERIALGPGAWQQLPQSVRLRFIANAPTFRDELRDPEIETLDLNMLHRFTAPIVLSRGEISPPFFGLVVAQIRQSLPHVELRIIPRAGHVPHATTPGQYVQMVMEAVTASAQ